MQNDNGYQRVDLIVIHDDTTVFLTTSSQIITGTAAVGTFTSVLTSGTVNIFVTPQLTSSTSTYIAFARTLINNLGSISGALTGDLMLQSGTTDLMLQSGTQDLNN